MSKSRGEIMLQWGGPAGSAAPHHINSRVQAAAPHLAEKEKQAALPHDIENPNPYMHLGAWMMEELKSDIPSPMDPSRCIFRVPHRLRCEREKAVHYTPQVISIGPLHHGNPALKAMEGHKKRYLQYFMGRTNNLSLMNEYKEKIKKEEAKLRSCYSETIDLEKFESDEFVKIILVDAIFIIEFLFRNWYPELLDENDGIFGKPGMVEDVWPDLLMLENQLPFFILVDLFDPHIFPVPSKYSDRLNGVERLSILFLSHYFLNGVPTFWGRSDDLETICSSEGDCLQYSPAPILPPIGRPSLRGWLLGLRIRENPTLSNGAKGKHCRILASKVEHFVDLLRKLCIAPMLKEQYVGQSKPTTESLADVGQEMGHMIVDELVRADVHDKVGDISEDALDCAADPHGLRAGQSKYTIAPSIEELHLAGVKFKVGSTNNLFDIQFEHGILKIPKLKTDDRTELMLRNLVAFEQCAFISIDKNKSAFEECYISDYVGIMDQFVDTSKDVELLVKNKIVENILGGGNDALSTMINSVSTGVICLCENTNLAYVTLCEKLNEFCGSNWNKSKANLRQNYFNTPWATISFFAAVILLILTVVQTICSIISLS